MPEPKPLLRHRVNPCDIDRDPRLAPIGDALHNLYSLFTKGTECTCCLGTRLVALAIVSFVLGALVF